jgi:hypothetical protein
VLVITGGPDDGGTQPIARLVAASSKPDLECIPPRVCTQRAERPETRPARKRAMHGPDGRNLFGYV